MKILVINNGTGTLKELEELLASHHIDVISYLDIEIDKVEEYESIILTGGHDYSVFGHEKLFEKEIYLIRNSKKPIFGICFGFEIIAYTFGSKLEILEDKEKGNINIKVLEPNELFLNIDNLDVYESHRWIVKEIGNELQVLAVSKNGIEAVRHKTLPIYGVQFHPEVTRNTGSKNNVLLNFLRIAETM